MPETAIYLRTSKTDKCPENQLADCEDYVKRNLLGDFDVIKEKRSAFKGKRPNFNKLLNDASNGKYKNIVIWDFDRFSRKREKIVELVTGYSKLGVKIRSVRQEWLEKLHKIPSPWNVIVFDLLLQVVAWMAEEESKKRSERIKLAVVKKGNKTVSYKGNKWGRKKAKVDIIRTFDLRSKGYSIREIAKVMQIGYGTINNVLKNHYRKNGKVYRRDNNLEIDVNKSKD